MIVETMAFKEVRAELNAELPEVQKRVENIAPKYDNYLRQKSKRFRSANQRRQYREPKAYRFTSAKKNKWMLIFNRDELGILITYIVRFNSKKGPTAYLLGSPLDWRNFKTRTLARFTGHFFSRYRERCKLENTTPAETIETYFKNNPRLGCIPYENITDTVARIYTPQKQGLALGFIDQDADLHVYNTFLSHGETKGDQTDVHAKITADLRQLLRSNELPAETIITAKSMIENLEGREPIF